MDAFLFWLLALLVLAYGSSLFVAMPISMPLLYVYAWWQEVRALGARYGRPRVIAVTGAVLIACLILVLQTSRQPQHRAFALLETPPTSLDGVRTRLQQEDTIRTGLVNAYLAPYRYFGAVGVAQDVSDMYVYALDVPQAQAMRIQQVYEAVARPILYEPVNTPPGRARSANRALQEEAAQAAEMYEAFFDREIVEGERDAVLRAVRSTWSIDQARAARRDVGDSEVHLKQQEISITENGDWAEVELYEVYQNHTTQRQEVVYYFSLPESAVITGVWLGNSANRAARFVYQVAPRGAAQQVYRTEVRYNRDPALVEQIGPRQYRLRVFPIEPQRWRWNGNRSYVEAGPEMHMWLTWRILAAADTWPLPRLAEKRNVYWDGDSVRLVSGERMVVDEENWLPASVPATSPVEPATHRVDFPGGRTVLIQPTTTVDSPQPAAGLLFGVVLDRSRSMAQHAADVETALAQLTQVADSGVSIDVYLTASQYRGEAPSRASLAEIVPDEIIYYGGQNAAELLAQFDELRAGDDYDVILVLTDGTGYELGDHGIAVPIPAAPVWMVHLAGDFPLGYDDATLEAIQASGGGAASSIGEALTRSAGTQAISQTIWSDVIDGYTWLTVPTEVAEAQLEGTDTVIVDAASGDFAAFAARQLILAEMRRQQGQMDQLETLDHLHAIAVEHSIVTPYSSMIVLVEQRQEELLEELETQGDRFEREHEAVGETTPPSTFDLPGETTPVSTPNVTGVPEPEEWLLLVSAAVMLIWYAYTKRPAPRRQYIR
jgi:putative PEP-CTERM system integral membrane protein